MDIEYLKAAIKLSNEIQNKKSLLESMKEDAFIRVFGTEGVKEYMTIGIASTCEHKYAKYARDFFNGIRADLQREIDELTNEFENL